MSDSEPQVPVSRAVEALRNRLKIGDWVADPLLDELSRDGQTVKLEPRKMRLLLALASRPQQVVTLDQLLDEVWSDLVVTPSSVYQSISQLRSVLGDDTAQPRYIATVPRKGYRLIAEVEAIAPDPQTEPLAEDEAATPSPALVAPRLPVWRQRRLWLGGGAAAALGSMGLGWWWLRPGPMPADAIMLAVLPFDDKSPKALEQALADGLADGVISALARHQQVRVAARATSFQYRSADALAPQAARLAVTHVLAGELRRWKEGVQLKLSLHRATDSELLWRHAIESPLAALGSLAFSAANAALQALGAVPLPASSGAPPLADAYELYLLGLQHQHSGQIAGILKARAYFQRAIDSDPGFALAYIGQAATWIAEYHYGSGLSFRAMDARAQPLIDRALQLDPELPLALGLQGHLKANLSQHEEARRWLSRAVEKAPSDASLLNWSGSNESDDGWPARARPFFTQAAQLSPLAVQIQHRAGLAAIHAGQYALAEAAYQRAIALAPQHANGHWGLGILGFARGRLADAVLGYRKALLLDPHREALWDQLAWLYLDLGMTEQAHQAFAQFQRLSATPASARMSAARQWVQAGDPLALAEALRVKPLQPAQATAERDAVIDAALLRLLLGQPDAALQALESVVGLVLADPVPLYNNWLSFQGHHILLDVAAIYCAADRRDQAEPFIESASGFIERYVRQGNVWHAAGYHRARVEALRGRSEPALAALEDGVRLGWRRGWWLAQDPALQSLRELPRFKALLGRIEQSNQEQRRKLTVA